MDKVLVFLSTYNGEKYLEEFLESLVAQEGVAVNVLVRDDCSKDNTVKILKKWREKFDFFQIYEGINVGAKSSFIKLIQYELKEKYEYYAFADQDDFWECNKLYEAIEKIKCEDRDKPILYCSKAELVDEKLNPIQGGRYPKKAASFGRCLIKNDVSGCTMVFNETLYDVIHQHQDINIGSIPLHDHWIYMICCGIGGQIIYDPHSYIKYRQHRNNVVGSRRLVDKIKENQLFHKGNVRYGWAEELVMAYGNEITEDNKRLCEIVLHYEDDIMTKMKLAFNCKIKPGGIIENFIIFLTVLLGKY